MRNTEPYLLLHRLKKEVKVVLHYLLIFNQGVCGVKTKNA